MRKTWLGLLSLLVFVSSAQAWAKNVSIEWKPVPHAIRYELQVAFDGKIVLKKVLEETSWRGELEPGVYSYQVRAIDRVKRASGWTHLQPLVVTPKSPEPTLPEDGQKVVLFDPRAKTTLKWKPSEGAKSYRIELKHGDRVIRNEVIQGSELTLDALPPGKFQWTVTALFEPQDRSPASFLGRKWEGKPSDSSEFKVEHEKLKQPELVFPIGKFDPPSGGKVSFKWKSVDGAEAYEVQLFSKKARGRAVANATAPLVRAVVKDNAATIRVSGEGQYIWRVRALANIDSKNTAQAAGQQSVAEFSLDKNASYFEGSGYLALSTMFAPYYYELKPSYLSQSGGHVGSTAATMRGSGEYWFHPQFGASAAVEATMFQISQASYSRKGFELLGKYRMKFGIDKYSWVLSPKLGIEGRDYIEILQRGGSLDVMALGVALGADLRKQLTEKLSLGIKFAYFKPIALSGDQVDQLTGDASNRNFSVGAQLMYWLNAKWGMGAGAYLEKRSISYTVQGGGAASASKPEQVFMDGSYFFGSLLYSFGR